MKFLQTKPPVKNMNIKYYDLYYTVIKNRNDKSVVEEEDENNENEKINFEDYITPNYFDGRKNDDVVLR